MFKNYNQEQFENEPTPQTPQESAPVGYSNRGSGLNVNRYQASSNLKVIVMLVVVMACLLGVIGYYMYNKYIVTGGQGQNSALVSNNPMTMLENFVKGKKGGIDTSDVVKQEAGVVNVNNTTPQGEGAKTTTLDVDMSAGAPDDMVADDTKKIAVTVGGGGRQDPFMPYVEKNLVMFNPDFDIVAPPEQLVVDTQVQDMMKATVSGIMYQSGGISSAVINVNGEDQLVRRGDKVDGQSIIDITKDRVVLKQGSNIYRVAVGQALDIKNPVKFNNVSNLNRKFGGSTSRARGVIEINIKDAGVRKVEKVSESAATPSSGVPQIPTL